MKCIYTAKGNVYHKIGNIISSLLGIIDGIISIVTLGNIYACLSYWFTVKRLGSKFWKIKQS